jgi:hypothetical protein
MGWLGLEGVCAACDDVPAASHVTACTWDDCPHTLPSLPPPHTLDVHAPVARWALPHPPPPSHDAHPVMLSLQPLFALPVFVGQVGVTQIILAISYRPDVMMEFLREIESLVRRGLGGRGEGCCGVGMYVCPLGGVVRTPSPHPTPTHPRSPTLDWRLALDVITLQHHVSIICSQETVPLGTGEWVCQCSPGFSLHRVFLHPPRPRPLLPHLVWGLLTLCTAGPLALAREHLETADHFFVFNRYGEMNRGVWLRCPPNSSDHPLCPCTCATVTLHALHSDVTCEYPLEALLEFHKGHGKEGTIMVRAVCGSPRQCHVPGLPTQVTAASPPPPPPTIMRWWHR